MGIWEDCHIRSSKERSLLYIGSNGFWGPNSKLQLGKVIVFVMKARCSLHVRNGHVCKDTWETLSGDFKKTYDYMAKIGHNKKNTSWWVFKIKQHYICHVNLNKDYTIWLKKLLDNKLIYESPNIQDLLNDLNKVYKPTKPMMNLTTTFFKKHI